MHRDGVQFREGLAEEGRRRFRNVFMGGAVEAIAADAQLFVQRVGQGIQIRFGSQGHAEFGIENAHIGNAGEELFRNVDAHQVGRVVQRAEGEAVADDFFYLFVDKHGIGDRFAAMQHAVPDCRDFRLVLNNALFGVQKQGNDVFHPFNVRGEGTLDNDFLFLVCTGSNLMAQFAHRLPDTFDDTGAQNGLVVHIEQLVFTRRRTRVDDQNFHCSTS